MIDLGQYDAMRYKPAKSQEELNAFWARQRAISRALREDDAFWAEIDAYNKQKELYNV